MIKFAWLIVFAGSFLPGWSQDVKKDSLLQLLSTSKKDTNEVMVLLNLADLYETNNQDSAIYYLEAARSLSKTLNYLKGLYKYYEQSAIVSYTKGDYTAAMDQSKQALAAARQLKDSTLVINMLNNTSIVYMYLGNFEAQLDYTLQAIKAVEAIRDSSKLSAIYHNLSNVYYNLNQYRKSTDNALLSLKLKYAYKKKNRLAKRKWPVCRHRIATRKC